MMCMHKQMYTCGHAYVFLRYRCFAVPYYRYYHCCRAQLPLIVLRGTGSGPAILKHAFYASMHSGIKRIHAQWDQVHPCTVGRPTLMFSVQPRPQVRAVYRKKGWALSNVDHVEQCAHDHYSESIKEQMGEGCRMWGMLEVRKHMSSIRLG